MVGSATLDFQGDGDDTPAVVALSPVPVPDVAAAPVALDRFGQ